MKYAIKYFSNCRAEASADEIIIQYTHKSKDLIRFVQEYDEKQRIVVDINNLEDSLEDSLAIFEAAHTAHKAFAVKLSWYQPYFHIIESGIPFFFKEDIYTLDDLAWCLKMGVSDVYITNELGFNIKEVSKVCRENKVQVRVYPNVAQSTSPTKVDTFSSFYVRPDAVKLYEPYVDIFEFYGPLDRQSVLYDIYTEGRWPGPLKDIILNLDNPIDNQAIMPYFDIARLNCKKSCCLGKCEICNKIDHFSKTLDKWDIGIIKKKGAIDAEDEYEATEDFVSTDPDSAFEELNGLLEDSI